jgi:hypothetical protein
MRVLGGSIDLFVEARDGYESVLEGRGGRPALGKVSGQTYQQRPSKSESSQANQNKTQEHIPRRLMLKESAN